MFIRPQPQSQQNQILKYDHTFNTQFTQTGQRPQNFIKNISTINAIKIHNNKKRNHPPVFIKADLEEFQLSQNKFGGKFDVILIDPPWEEYEKRAKRVNKYQQRHQMYKCNCIKIIGLLQIAWTMEKLAKLKISQIGQTPSFIFLWVGSQHLQDGRQLLKTWNYKRCQDIIWVKTNVIRRTFPPQSQQGIFTRVKQHCLMGYKGQPKKPPHIFSSTQTSTLTSLSHNNHKSGHYKNPHKFMILFSVSVQEEKIQLFGNVNNIRNGWVTVGNMLKQTRFDVAEYNKWFKEDGNIMDKDKEKVYHNFVGGRYVGTNPTIESLRPKEDAQNDKTQQQNSSAKLLESNIDDAAGKRSLAKSDTSRN